MTQFTPWSAAAGGALIGVAAVLLLAVNGRIAGVSGIAAGALFGHRGDRTWRVLFCVGLIAGTVGWLIFAPGVPSVRSGFSPGLLVLSGLAVGYGTALGGGCTSGHGVCGVARLSARSLAATAVFLLAGIVTTFVSRHLMHLS